MMRTAFCFAAISASVLLVSAPARAAVTVVGSTAARGCYEAAERDEAGRHALAQCDEALKDGQLTGFEQIATYVNRGIVRMHGKDMEGALADFDTAIARNPGQPEAYLNKGVLLLARDGWEAALPMFTMAIDKGTKRPELAFFGRGIANEAAGRIEDAYFDYKKANEIAPDWDQPRDELSRFSVVPKARSSARGAIQ